MDEEKDTGVLADEKPNMSWQWELTAQKPAVAQTASGHGRGFWTSTLLLRDQCSLQDCCPQHKDMEPLEQVGTRITILFLLEQKSLERLNSSPIKTDGERWNCSAWRILGCEETIKPLPVSKKLKESQRTFLQGHVDTGQQVMTLNWKRASLNQTLGRNSS